MPPLSGGKKPEHPLKLRGQACRLWVVSSSRENSRFSLRQRLQDAGNVRKGRDGYIDPFVGQPGQDLAKVPLRFLLRAVLV